MTDNLLPNGIGQLHESFDKIFLDLGVILSADKVPNRLVEDVDLRWRKIADNRVQIGQQLIDKRLLLANLNL